MIRRHLSFDCSTVFVLWRLNDNEEVLFVGSNHHFELLAADTEECEVVGRVHITHQVPRLLRQLGQVNAIVARKLLLLGLLRESRLDDGGCGALVSLVRHNEQTLDTLLTGDALNAHFDVGLIRTEEKHVSIDVKRGDLGDT